MDEIKITPEESAMLLHGREYKVGEEGELISEDTWKDPPEEDEIILTTPMKKAIVNYLRARRALATEYETAMRQYKPELPLEKCLKEHPIKIFAPAAENVSDSDTPGGKGNYALQEAQKKADMKEGLRKLIMSAIKNATEGKIRNDAATIETLKALPEAIRVYLSLSETLPQKLNEKIEEQKKALSGW